MDTPLSVPQIVVRVVLFLFAAMVYLIAAGVFVAGCGRLLSMSKVGLPEPHALWLGYLVPELVLPWVLAAAHFHRPQA